MKTGKELSIKKIKKHIYNNLSKIKGKRVFLFSVSQFSQLVADELMKENIMPVGILDNSVMQQGRKWNDIQVRNPEIMTREKDFVIIICGGFWKEKLYQLKKLGISKKNIIIIEPYKYTILKRIFLLFNGWNIYKRLKNGDKNKQILFCQYPGTGDAYITGRYLKYYIEENCKDENYVIVSEGNAFKKVLQLYGYEKIEVISTIEKECFNYLISVIDTDVYGIHYMLFWGLPYQNADFIGHRNMLSFCELFEKTVFGNTYHTPILPYFTNDAAKINAIVNKYEIKKGKTVILAPYASSFKEELGVSWWEKLVSELLIKGYVVFTNSCSKNEMVIYGSKMICLPYEDMCPILEIGGYFIGVRSGLFDLMSSAKCKKIIIYQNIMSKEGMKHFSLNYMKLCDDAIEFWFENSNRGKVQLLKDILAQL